MRKQDLYRKLMENVKVGLSKALNEDFQFDDTEIADKIFELVRKDRQIQNVVKNASANDWASVIRGITKLVKGKNVPENPEKIKNQVDLAAAIINRGFDSKLKDKVAEMTNEDINYAATFLANQISKQYGEKKDAEDPKEKPALTDGKQCEGKSCQEGKNCNEKEENKHVSESRNFRRQGGFSKFLNENKINLHTRRY